MGLTTTQPKRCALYARHSPKPEGAAGDNFSIDSQLHEMRARALKKYGCPDPVEYIDKNKSGATLDRPSLDRLRDDIALKLYDVVIAYSPDRWTRGGRWDSLILDKELQKGGATLDFVSGSYEDTAEGRLARKIQDDVSEFEREKFRERAERCRRQKSRDGHPHACHPPDGYKYEGHKFGKKGEYVIVPERAKIVRLIFEKTAQGMTNSKLAIWLNEQGIKTHNGHLYQRPSVAQILAKTAYYGEMIQNGETIYVPAIVTRELWDRAHEALALNKVGRVGRPSNQYELTGLLWCRRCRKRCATFPNHGHPLYRCNHIDLTNRSIRLCFAPSISKAILEAVIWNALWDTVCDPGLLWKLIEAYHDRVAGRPTKKKNPAIARIERAQRLVARAYQIFKDPDCPVPYAQAKADFEAAKKELAEAQIGGRAAVIELPNRKDVDAMSAAFQAMRHEVTEFADRKAVLNLLIAKILWADGEAEIHCHLPVENAGNCHSRIGPDSERKRNYSDDCETRISSH